MPYINGVRVSAAKWQETYGSLQKMHTGPNGDNPASPPDLDPETRAPKQEKRAGSKRSSRSTARVAAAIADATGQDLPDITGLDAGQE